MTKSRRSKRVIYPDVSVQAWSKRWGVDPTEGICKCGKKHKATKPFLSLKCVGFVSEKCDCGVLEPVITCVPLTTVLDTMLED
jgi:hypothetical protein